MKQYKSAAFVAAITSMWIISGCGEKFAAQPEPTLSVGAWSQKMTSIKLANGRTVSLQIAHDVAKSTGGSSRCWRLVESQDDGSQVAATSACHARPATAASRVFGAVVVVSACTSSSAASIHGTPNPTTVRDLFDGIFLAPPSSVSEHANALTYSCTDSSGASGQPIELQIAQ